MTHLAHLNTAPPALILFGNDHAGRPHAAWFTSDELVVAERASGALGYVALRVTNEEEQSLALQLPRGRKGEQSGQGDVRLPRPRTLDAIALVVAKGARRGIGERSAVQIAVYRLRAIHVV